MGRENKSRVHVMRLVLVAAAVLAAVQVQAAPRVVVQEGGWKRQVGGNESSTGQFPRL